MTAELRSYSISYNKTKTNEASRTSDRKRKKHLATFHQKQTLKSNSSACCSATAMLYIRLRRFGATVRATIGLPSRPMNLCTTCACLLMTFSKWKISRHLFQAYHSTFSDMDCARRDFFSKHIDEKRSRCHAGQVPCRTSFVSGVTKVRGVMRGKYPTVLHSILSEVEVLYSTVSICQQHLSDVFLPYQS